MILFILHYNFESLPPVFHLLFTTHFVEVKSIICLWMLFHEVYHVLDFISNFFPLDKKLKLFLVKCALRTLFKKVWVDNITLDTATEDFWVEFV